MKPRKLRLPTQGTLGTFGGVFTPSILTILGIILFLRVGWVTGEAGFGRALLIICIANGISILTSLSVSAIATNIKVGGGGDYYVISRTLGVGFGGSIGLVLFLSQAVSVAFYALGFGEAAAVLIGGPSWTTQAVAAAAILALFLLAWLGSDWATKFQYFVMVVLFSAIALFLFGAYSQWSPGQLRENFAHTSEYPFWTLFAVFFPAVTGFTQGVSMSGDLKAPGRSIPQGTLMAVGISFVIYVIVAIGFAGALSNERLSNDYTAFRELTVWPWIADAGVFAATLSSALASFLGAPRILQALARDRLFPFLNPFAVGSGSAGNPRRGVLLTLLIALITVTVGRLNLIAPVVSAFFLISYGLLNFATFAEARSNSPFFRPRFRWFDARLSFAGAAGCLAALVALDPIAAVASLAVLAGVYHYLERSVKIERWADNSRSVAFQRVRQTLEKMSTELEHPRDWRPVILAFSEDPDHRERLVRFAQWIEGDTGLVTVVQLLQGLDAGTRARAEEIEKKLRAEFREKKLHAFAAAVVAPDIGAAVPVLLQAHGLGPIRANTVVVNWIDEESASNIIERHIFGRNLRIAVRLGTNIVVLSAAPKSFRAIDKIPEEHKRIDVLYLDDATGHLMLFFAYLMTRTEDWHDAKIRLIAVASGHDDCEEKRKQLTTRLEDVRIRAKIDTLETTDIASVANVCKGAALVFSPLRIKGDDPVSPFEATVDDLVKTFPVCAFCLAAEPIDLDAEPEGGQHGEIAKAQEAAEKALERATSSEKELREAEKKAERSKQALEAAVEQGEPEEIQITLRQEATRDEAAVAETMRRVARDQAKADDAAETAAAKSAGESGTADAAKRTASPGE